MQERQFNHPLRRPTSSGREFPSAFGPVRAMLVQESRVTSIDRDRFVNDLRATSLDLRRLPEPISKALHSAGIAPSVLDQIAGSDHVISGDAECEALYRALIAAESRTHAAGTSGHRTDYARAVYEAIRATRGPAPPPEPPPSPSGPTRFTGILAPQVAKVVPERSDYVRALGDSAASALAQKAPARRRIQAMTDRATDKIRRLEEQARALSFGSQARTKIEDEIETYVSIFENELAAARAIGTATTATSAQDSLTKHLPPYVRESVDREGLVIPGAPGAISPQFGKTPGFTWRIKF